MMVEEAPIPHWATDKRAFKAVTVSSGIALGTLIALVAALEPSVLQAVVDVLFVPIILVAVVITLPVIGLRTLLLRGRTDQDVPTTRWLVVFVLSTLPIGVAILLLGALTTAAFVFKLHVAPALAVGIVTLAGIWVLFSLSVKILVNLQLLMRHWDKI